MADTDKRVDPQISKQVLKLRDLTLLEGAMATGALVALADRRLSIEESIAMKIVLETMEQLAIHDPRFALGIYSRYVDAIRSEPEDGRAVALKAIAKCAEDIDAAELIVRVGITIAKADQDFSAPEVEAIEEICACVGIEGLDALALAGAPTARAH